MEICSTFFNFDDLLFLMEDIVIVLMFYLPGLKLLMLFGFILQTLNSLISSLLLKTSKFNVS